MKICVNGHPRSDPFVRSSHCETAALCRKPGGLVLKEAAVPWERHASSVPTVIMQPVCLMRAVDVHASCVPCPRQMPVGATGMMKCRGTCFPPPPCCPSALRLGALL
eukprot:361940-Chlamydomonas_euryale.AAC.4